MKYLIVEVPDDSKAAALAEQIEQGTDGVRACYEHTVRSCPSMVKRSFGSRTGPVRLGPVEFSLHDFLADNHGGAPTLGSPGPNRDNIKEW